MPSIKASDQAAALGTFVPAGVVIPFAGATAPSGWLLCNGSAVSRTTYAALFAAIASAWGYGDNSTTFNLPDLRGRFLRGRDGGAGRDPNAATRTAPQGTGNGNAGDAVGSVQAEATKKNGLSINAGFSFSDPGHGHAIRQNGSGGALAWPGGGGSTYSPSSSTSGASDSFAGAQSASTNISCSSNPTLTTGDSETRPLNANVNYIIKY